MGTLNEKIRGKDSVGVMLCKLIVRFRLRVIFF